MTAAASGKKTAIVTGASSGLGLYTTKALVVGLVNLLATCHGLPFHSRDGGLEC